MVKPQRASRREKGKAQTESYLGGLFEVLEAIDFEQARQAAQALGEAADPSAIKPLVSLVKGSARVRAAAIAGLKKISTENEEAATQLAIVLMEEKGEGTATEASLQPVALADRRRSPRVLLEIPVMVSWRDERGEFHRELTITRVVNACGALVILKRPVPLGLKLEIINRATQAMVQARVVWLGSECPAGGVQVGIELGEPDPEFWGYKASPGREAFF